MKIAVINGGVFGSTGAIISGIRSAAEREAPDIEFWIASPVTASNRNAQPEFPYYQIGSYNSRRVSVLLARMTGLNGCFAHTATRRYLSRLKQFSPDLIHIHTLHNSYINLPMFWEFIRNERIPAVWTLHDCWAFTGQCPHYTMVRCDKWKSGCGGCPQYRDYPEAVFDRTELMFKKKREMFTGIDALELVTPSEWLAGQVKESFLKDYPVTVINNGIDPEVFRPYDPSDFKTKYGIPQDKRLILGVAFGWSRRKGLDVFIELADRLDGDKYQIVLVGTDDNIDKQLPRNILSVHQTGSRTELAKIYSAADVFVNPTREDTFPTVNMEALACGTPVVTFDTGGSTEAIDPSCGAAVAVDYVGGIISAIEAIGKKTDKIREACLKRTGAFISDEKYREYLNLYREIHERVTKG